MHADWVMRLACFALGTGVSALVTATLGSSGFVLAGLVLGLIVAAVIGAAARSRQSAKGEAHV